MHYDNDNDQWTIIGTVHGEGYDCRKGEEQVKRKGKWNKVSAYLHWIKYILTSPITKTTSSTPIAQIRTTTVPSTAAG